MFQLTKIAAHIALISWILLRGRLDRNYASVCSLDTWSWADDDNQAAVPTPGDKLKQHIRHVVHWEGEGEEGLIHPGQAWDLDNSYIGDDRDIVVDIAQFSDPSHYLDLLFSLNTTPGNSNGQR